MKPPARSSSFFFQAFIFYEVVCLLTKHFDAIEKKTRVKRREEIIELTQRESTFGVILGIGGQTVISGKQQRLHSYNSSKCINDHDEGGSFRRDEPPRRRAASSHDADDGPDDCRAKRTKQSKRNSSHSFCHPKPTVPSGWEGQSSTVSTKVLPPSRFPPARGGTKALIS